MKSQDKEFAAATIQAIGRCATNISEVADTCLNGLVLLLSNRDGTVGLVGSSVCYLINENIYMFSAYNIVPFRSSLIISIICNYLINHHARILKGGCNKSYVRK